MRRTWRMFAGLLVAGVVLSIVLSWAGWRYGWGFLLLPFIFPPFVFRGGRRHEAARNIKTCPACGHATDDPLAAYCPRDASRLV